MEDHKREKTAEQRKQNAAYQRNFRREHPEKSIEWRERQYAKFLRKLGYTVIAPAPAEGVEG